MEYLIDVISKKAFKVKVGLDACPTNPREDDNFSKMVCFHSRYTLGDKHDINSDDYNSWDEMEKAIKKELKAAIILPLYLYDHSGITISTSPFSCRFDSGQIGFVYCTREDLKSLGTNRKLGSRVERAMKLIEAEVNEYDHYLTGEVYGYEICNDDDEVIASCRGYYDREECMKDGLLEVEKTFGS